MPALILFVSCFACSENTGEENTTDAFYATASVPRIDHYLYKEPLKAADGWTIAEVKHEHRAEELINTMLNDSILGISGVLLSRQGSLVLEEYKKDWPADTLLPLFENELLLIATLTGVVQKQQADLMDKLVKIPSSYYASKKKVSKDTAVDLRHLLKMESNLLCRPQQQLMQAVPDEAKPKKRFYYCPDNYQAIAQWLELQTDEPLSYYAEEKLFEPLEIDHYNWDDLAISMSARDMLKFSALHVQKGSWTGQQLLADDWVLQLQSRAYDADAQGQFAWGWWQQRLVVDGRQYAVFYSKGRSFMLVFVPDLDAGIVFTGNLAKKATDYFPLLQQHAIPALLKN